MVRGKFQVHSSRSFLYGQGKEFILNAVCDDGIEEHKKYSKYTPSGEIKIFVNNPVAEEQFKIGSYCYVDFTFLE